MEYLFEETRINTFKTQIRRSIEGFNGYDKTIKEIIIEARQLSLNKIDVYTVERDHFPMVLHLAIHGRSILPRVNDEYSLCKADLKELLSIFSK